jgi:succinate dehydrogenase / fumarate reductase membrane anchor subunit
MSRKMAGIQAWILQRISAVYLALFSPLALIYLLFYPPADYHSWLATVGNPWIFAALILFMLAVLVHTWVGVRNVVIDYIKPFGLRLIVLLMLGVALILAAIWILAILPPPLLAY